MSYNGWSNYETWNVYLWITNDEPIYRGLLDARPVSAADAESFCRRIFPEGTPDMDSAADLDAVDWNEIANAVKEDITSWNE